MHILAIDDHELFRAGLKHLLSAIDAEIVYLEASSIEDALQQACAGTPDLILLDYFLPNTNGCDALKQIRERFFSSTIVVLSSLDNAALIRQVIDQGASGFIPKSSSQSTLVSALQLILEGGVYLPQASLCGSPDPSPVDNSAPADLLESLTSRQRDVVRGVVAGKPNKIIAYDMQISEGTVKSHLSSAFKCLGVKSRTQAVILLARHPALVLQEH